MMQQQRFTFDSDVALMTFSCTQCRERHLVADMKLGAVDNIVCLLCDVCTVTGWRWKVDGMPGEVSRYLKCQRCARVDDYKYFTPLLTLYDCWLCDLCVAAKKLEGECAADAPSRNLESA